MKLKPCPFCKAAVTQLRDKDHPFVMDAFYCPGCGCRFRWNDIDPTDESAAISERKKWNRRTAATISAVEEK